MAVAVRPVVLGRFNKLRPLPFAMLAHAMYHGRLSTFRSPTTFTEMLVAKKLYDRNPVYPLTADKYTVREYVAQRVDATHLVPLIQVADRPSEIDFDVLPRPCVIKATHGYDMNIFLHEGETVDEEAARATMRRWLKKNFYENWHEWAYLDCRPRLVVEKFIGDGRVAPADYKFWVFHGRVEMIQVDTDRFTAHKTNLLSRDWNPLEVYVKFKPTSVPNRPDTLDEMVCLAEAIGADLEFARVDLYSVGGHVYFGEITHYPGGGCIVFEPRSFDTALGRLWRDNTPLPVEYQAHTV